MRGIVPELPPDPVIEMTGPLRDFAARSRTADASLGRDRDGEWLIYVYTPDSNGRLLASGSAPTRLHALEQAGLCGDDAGEVLGRAGNEHPHALALDTRGRQRRTTRTSNSKDGYSDASSLPAGASGGEG